MKRRGFIVMVIGSLFGGLLGRNVKAKAMPFSKLNETKWVSEGDSRTREEYERGWWPRIRILVK